MTQTAIITFSNNEKITVTSGQLIFPIIHYKDDDGVATTLDKPIVVFNHPHDGLIPCLTELLVSADFFSADDVHTKIYKSSAVVSIENI